MGDNKVIAKRLYKPFDLAMDKVWISIDSHKKHRYVLFHFLNNKHKFGLDYISCENVTQLNDLKSKIINNGFKIDWDIFNLAMRHLNEH